MSLRIKLILFSCALALSASTVSSVAQPLQGSVEQSNAPTRILRPSNDMLNPVIQGNANQDTQLPQQPPMVNTEQFSIQTPPVQLPANNQQIMGGTSGGQDEYWVSWDLWRHRIADAVWGPLKERRTIMWGMTRVDYDVTRDRHIRITAVRTPDPTGKSAKILVDAIMQLEGNPILAFPPGSKQTIHHSFNLSIGLPMPNRVHYSIYLPGGTEHVVDQW